MPIKQTGNFDLASGVLASTKAKLATFLTEEEISKTEIILKDGKLNFYSEKSILAKITTELGRPAERN